MISHFDAAGTVGSPPPPQPTAITAIATTPLSFPLIPITLPLLPLRRPAQRTHDHPNPIRQTRKLHAEVVGVGLDRVHGHERRDVLHVAPDLPRDALVAHEIDDE